MLTALHAELGKIVAFLGSGGPWLFFGAMTLLPCVGMPTTVFSVTAGSLFRARMGLPGVILATLGASMANIVLTYWLGKGALRPVLEKFMAKRGHKVPEVESGDAKDLIILVRLSPAPFFIKNYLLGMAEVPLGQYLLISVVIEGVYAAGFVIFGEALMHGESGMILIGGAVIAFAIAGTHLVRRHMGGKARKAGQ